MTQLSSFFPTSSSSASPESGLGTSHTSLPGSGQGSANEQINDDNFYDPEPLQPLGTCRALYPFEGTSQCPLLWLLFTINFIGSFQWRQYPDKGRRGTACDWIRPRWWMDARPTNERVDRRFCSYHIHWNHVICVGVPYFFFLSWKNSLTWLY